MILVSSNYPKNLDEPKIDNLVHQTVWKLRDALSSWYHLTFFAKIFIKCLFGNNHSICHG